MHFPKKLNFHLRSILAAASLFGGASIMAQTAEKQPSETNPSIVQTTSTLNKYNSFRGKDFDTRMKLAEEICQRNFLDQHIFNDIYDLILKDTLQQSSQICTNAHDEIPQIFLGEHRHFDTRVTDEIQQLVYLGHTLDEIDTSKPYAEQLRFCGFDLLADIETGNIDVSKLSDMEKSRALAQFKNASLLANLSINNKHAQNLASIIPHNIPLSNNSTILNGHKLKDATPYEEFIAKQVAQKIRNEHHQHFSPKTK